MAALASSAFFCSAHGLGHCCSLTILSSYAAVRPLTHSHRLIHGPSSSIFVGPTRKEFLVHKALLCHYSRYFRSALYSDFVEAKCNTVELKDEDPACFQYIIAWMYRGTLGQLKYYGTSNQEEAISLCTQTCRLYYLADFLRIEELLVQLLSYLRGLFDGFRDKKIVPLNSDVIVHLHENTTDFSYLRAMVMDELVHVWCDYSREVDIKDFEVCINQVEGVATTLLTAMRDYWEDKRNRSTDRTSQAAGMSPSAFEASKQLARNLVQVHNPLPSARPLALPAFSGPAPLAPRPAVTPQAAAPAPWGSDPSSFASVVPAPWTLRRGRC